MKKLIYIVGIITVFIMMSFDIYDFYSSMTKAEYDEGSKTVKFTSKMNTLHIAEVLKVNPENLENHKDEVKKYVNANFDVAVNGENKNLVFTGCQVNGESVWVYFESNGVSEINSLKIKNTVLLSAFPKQINMVNIAYKGGQKTMSFQRGKEVNQVEF